MYIATKIIQPEVVSYIAIAIFLSETRHFIILRFVASYVVILHTGLIATST